MAEYEKWWDEKIVADGSKQTIHGFKQGLDKNKSRYEYLRLIEKISPVSILDTGCGLGLDYQMYKDNHPNIKCYGIDVCKGFIKENKKNFPDANFMVARIQNMPFKDASIDLVTCRHLLEHLPEPESAIKEMTRVSKEYVSIIWFLIPQEKEQIKISQTGYYINIYSEKRIMKCLKDNRLSFLHKIIVKDNEVWVLKK